MTTAETKTVAARVISRIRELATEKADFVYEKPDTPGGTCLYVHQIKHDEDRTEYVPGCIVGQALCDLDIMQAGWTVFNSQTNREGVEEAFSELDIAASPIDMQWLTAVQMLQDQGAKWGEAVMRADSGERPQFP